MCVGLYFKCIVCVEMIFVLCDIVLLWGCGICRYQYPMVMLV